MLVPLLKIVRTGCGCVEQRPTNPPTIFLSSLASIGVRKDEIGEKFGMGTNLGRSNTAQHRHRPIDTVLLGPPKSAVALEGSVSSMVFLKMIS